MRTQFTQPAKLDGKQLIAELNAGGVVCTDLPNIDGDGNFWLDIDPNDVAKATPIVAAHVAVPYVDPAEAQRLIDRQAGIDTLVKLGLTEPQAEAIADGTH